MENRMHNLFHLLEISVINRKNLQIILSALKKVYVDVLHFHKWPVDLGEVKGEHFLFDEAEVLRIFRHNMVPISSSDCVAHNIRMSTINEEKSLLENSLICTNHSGMPKLHLVFPLLVDFITNVVFA